jgi:integrase
MASVRKTANGRYQAVGSVFIDGVRTQRARTFATRREAQAYANGFTRRELRGVVSPDDPLLALWIEQFLVWLAARAKPSSVSTYRRKLAYALPMLGGIRLSRLTSDRIDDLYTHLLQAGGEGGRPLGTATVHHTHKALSHCLNVAVKRNLIADNPAVKVAPKAPAENARAPSLEQIQALIAEARPEPLPLILKVLVATGIRRGEVLGLRWQDVDFDTATMTIRRVVEVADDRYAIREGAKTDAGERVIGLDEDLLDLLRRWRLQLVEQALALEGTGFSQAALIFPDLRNGDLGEPRNPNTVSAAAAKAAKRAGWPPGIHPIHGLRHAHATLLNELPLKVLAARLGHANPSFTARVYQHPNRAQQQAAALAAGEVFGAIIRAPAGTNVARKKGKN